MLSLVNPREVEIYEKRVRKNYSDLTLALPFLNIDNNSSAILRTASNFGVGTIYLIGSKKILKGCTCGTLKYTNYERLNTYSDLIARCNFRPIVVADCYGDILLPDFIWPPNPVLVMGHESGLEPKIREIADYKIKIPLYGVSDSFNVGVAAGIIMYEHRKQFEQR